MNAKIILALLAAVFLTLSITRIVQDGGKVLPASKAWLSIGFIFAAVSAWLFFAT